MCIMLYTLLKVVNYYDLSFLSMSVMGLQQQQKFKVADLQSYNFKIYKSLPKTYNINHYTSFI